MLAHPEADLSDISAATGQQPEDVRGALNELARLALIRWQPEDATRPALNDPAVALTALLARQQSEITERQLRIEESRAAIAELVAARAATSGEQIPDTERILGIDAVRERIDDLASTCREEVWSFNPGGPQSEMSLRRSRPASEETLDRGIRMRAIYLDSIRNDDPSTEHLRWLTEKGAEIRTVPALPIRMIIADRSRAVVPMDERSSAQGALIVANRGMIAGLVALFVATWNLATPFGPRQGREPGRPTTQEQAALRLWAQGATDATVARTLGISERTVRRMSETLAARLDARSRFEAGARAMNIGWLTGDDLI